MSARADQAAERFDAGFNCAQSVFAVFAEPGGLDVETAMKIASPFGAGVGGSGGMCGAAAGALMALGLLAGDDSGRETGRAYRMARQCLREFESACGALGCKELLAASASAGGGRYGRCADFVRIAVEIVESMLDD